MCTRLLLASSPRNVIVERGEALYHRLAGHRDQPLTYRGPLGPYLKELVARGGLRRVLGPDGEGGPVIPDEEGSVPALRPVKLPTGELIFQVADRPL